VHLKLKVIQFVSGNEKQKCVSPVLLYWTEHILFLRISSSFWCICFYVQILSRCSWTKN